MEEYRLTRQVFVAREFLRKKRVSPRRTSATVNRGVKWEKIRSLTEDGRK